MDRSLLDNLPDVRDGLNRKQRLILYCLHQLQMERQGRNVSTAMLYGRVLERIDMSQDEFQAALVVIESHHKTAGETGVAERED